MKPALRFAGQTMYLQVYQVLRSRLEMGVWQQGQTMPPLPVLMEEFGASRVTVREAMHLLEREGLIRRRRGIGTTVEAIPLSDRWVRIATSMDELLQMQRAVQPTVLNINDHAGLPDVQLPSDQTAAQQYVRMQRVHLRQDRPYCVIDLSIESGLFKRHEQAFLQRPALLVMHEDTQLRVTSARQDLSIRCADLVEARHLAVVPGSPVAEVRRVLSDEAGVVVYAAVVVYPSHMVRLSMDLLAPGNAIDRKATQ
ncbi:GntR family transcriptional regulator [Ramlibacter sp. AN1015]|uniref:GntR family transcriptional regulator n=1 Tax=Ramlibacter sp. AN1015 TaxID=3133428 RepID=UPI0030BAC85A